jgi:hypothetical protein
MISGGNKIIFFKLLSSIFACVAVILAHQMGYEWYMGHFRPRSHGVTLGFVMFYMNFIIMPCIFISPFLRVRFSLFLMLAVFLWMFYIWYGSNPLRVLLMFLSGLAGYGFILIGMLIIKLINSQQHEDKYPP